jgi:hypothetical protein
MKKTILLAAVVAAFQCSHAQLTITPNKTATYLANKLVATSGTLGVNVTNALLTCDTNANGEFTGASNLGIADGIALGTGDVATNTALSTFGLDGHPIDFASTMNNAAGDAQLAAIVTATTYDACVLEFDMQPVGSFVEFEYVFGSEEYPEFNCSAFNDVFGFFISGPGFAAPTNIALIPSTTTAVSINSINDGSVTTCSANTALYVNNTDTLCTMDGFTVPLVAHANVTSGATYHLKMAVADVMDGVFNSYVILKANSLKSGGIAPSGVNLLSVESGIEVYPTLIDNVLTVNNRNHQAWTLVLNDMNGHVVYSSLIQEGQSQLNIQTSSLAKGIYVLKMERNSDHKTNIQKLIKK